MANTSLKKEGWDYIYYSTIRKGKGRHLNKKWDTVQLPQDDTIVGVPGHEVNGTNTHVNNLIHVDTIL